MVRIQPIPLLHYSITPFAPAPLFPERVLNFPQRQTIHHVAAEPRTLQIWHATTQPRAAELGHTQQATLAFQRYSILPSEFSIVYKWP
jgi:hypothetical protein